ncbi:flagellar export protein FliJ [Brevibacillus fulvus]|uniref:Flagellar FliJ protein n=1 Tax=Brevibacillus fulvus TaxID=1125967 RepID=A0A939BPM0_9BACL|nr:flagellar FliJ protein [Brevibacillus fulvus]
MAKFTYHLQKVLDLKEKETEQARWALGKSLQKKEEEEKKLDRLTERRNRLTDYLFEVQDQACSAAQLIEISRYRQVMDRAIDQQLVAIHGCELEAERHKVILTERMRESQLWQKLRERSQEQFQYAESVKEQKELDEIGLIRYIRRSN